MEGMLYCPACEKDANVDLMAISHYFHILWIPCFPTELEIVTFCKNCGLKREGVALEKFKLSSNYEQISRIRHPLFTYIGVALLPFPSFWG
jgi:C4-type Zn-finger protein